MVRVSRKKKISKAVDVLRKLSMLGRETPATPPEVPVPYPNTSMAKDTTNGSKKVKISGKMIMLKNKSIFGKSEGDEAGTEASPSITKILTRTITNARKRKNK